jgi:glycosyltransferase involved in cell wall biosynthesis
LNTTTYESFGNCVVEAASCGIPIVSNKVGELPFIWEDESSICFFKNNNPDELAKNVIRILNDGEFATKLKTNARKKSEEYERSRVMNSWMKIILNE